MSQIQFHMGGRITQVIDRQGSLQDNLPAGIYTVKFCGRTEIYYLELSKDLPESPSKIYGNVNDLCNRIFNRWESRNCSTGIGLTGYKGTGKSLLAKELCTKAIELGLPVIMVNDNHWGDNFNQFLSNITQRSVVLFEEFDKVYSERDEQVSLLTLLDGIHNSNKLWIFTSNEDLPYFFRNRPSRIYYHIDYGSHLEKDIVEQFCLDNLKDTSRISEIIRLSNVSKTFNFDMLQSVVSEMNFAKGDSLEDILNILNIDTSLGNVIFDMELTTPDNEQISGLYGYPSDIFDYNQIWVRICNYLNTDDASQRMGISEGIYNRLIHSSEGAVSKGIQLDSDVRDRFNLPQEFAIPTQELKGNTDGSFTYEVDGFKFKFIKRPQYDYRSL